MVQKTSIRENQGTTFLIGAIFLLSLVSVRSAIAENGPTIKQYTETNSVEPTSLNNLSRRKDWEKQQVPEFCNRILANPKPFNRCHRKGDMSCRENPSETVMFSQFQQDHYLFTNHFKHLKRPGVYVDIAANDPISISNTYFFDRCLQWSGLCVEANPMYFEPLYRERSCQVVPTCVGSKEGELVEFGLDGGAGGVLGDTYKSTKRLQRLNRTIPSKPLRCTTMENVFDRNIVKEVDLLSLDVEGHEMEVLKGFGLDNVVVKVMTIEITGSDLVKIESFLNEKGYKRHYVNVPSLNKKPGFLQEDAVFLHESVTFGKP